MVLKPSEEAPIDAHHLVAKSCDAAGTPKGVYNMIKGSGAVVGEAMSAHPDIDMMSFTGSTRAGIRVAQAAADDREARRPGAGRQVGQHPAARRRFPDGGHQGHRRHDGNSRPVVHRADPHVRAGRPADEVKSIAKAAAERFVVGDPRIPRPGSARWSMPAQYEKIQRLIQAGIDEGAELVTGGPGRPENLNRGYYVRPTVFAGVTNDMTIAREEIFGPVIAILPYKSEEEVIRMANETVYGLAAYVQSGDIEHARKVASQMRAGNVHLNYPVGDTAAPFGGYKQSGNGREYGKWGLEEFLETKAVIGYRAA